MPHISAGRPDGTGLGLKIVTDLVSWHGGQMQIDKSDGGGTRFRITLPHASPGAPRDAEAAETKAADEAADGAPVDAEPADG